jgi:hypothetical protein
VFVVLVQIFFDAIPLACKLPGDIHVKKEDSEFSFSIAARLGFGMIFSGLGWLKFNFSKKYFHL